ncbi:AAA family ATPase [Arcicella rigui]|uniref:AAA family ATPase n=1 Tax=Arcicella rigui TaxID=797020 RepID=A0ABU5Q9C7_9BACT|nr:AAA family ATPase [Arcicella rigui]MEA5139439.1 AAA family ATPase [Arcicella rigui]
MLIELQNFGPIKSFQFDTSKDIHAIFGKNNIGKSYAISAVYLILKNLSDYSYYDNEYTLDFALSYEKTAIEKTVEKRVFDLNFLKYDIKKEILEYFKGSLNTHLLSGINNSLKNTFDLNSIQNINSDCPIKIIISFSIGVLTIDFDTNPSKAVIGSLELTPNFEIYNSETNVNSTKDSFSFYIKNEENGEKVIYGLRSIMDTLHKNLKRDVKHFSNQIYFLPASRSGLYNALNSFGAIFAELSRNRNFIRQKIEIPNISEPISDYFLRLNTIDKAQVNEKYVEYFEEIEKDILKGTITLDTETKKYFYTPQHSEIKLELSFTSSMISEIAPIIAHLKYIIPFGDKSTSILFIEEPEAHLHPEVQVALLNFFVKLSKANVKIVMTSHSNYIFNKLSNLIIAKEIQPENISISLMKMTNQGSVIEDGAMAVDEHGIEDNNFVDIAEQLYEERMQLLEKL